MTPQLILINRSESLGGDISDFFGKAIPFKRKVVSEIQKGNIRRRIELTNGDKYYKRSGEVVTEVIGKRRITGMVVIKHPNFDPALVRNEHYYGEIKYYLEY